MHSHTVTGATCSLVCGMKLCCTCQACWGPIVQRITEHGGLEHAGIHCSQLTNPLAKLASWAREEPNRRGANIPSLTLCVTSVFATIFHTLVMDPGVCLREPYVLCPPVW